MKLKTKPRIRTKPEGDVDYADLEHGDLFFYDDNVFIKTGNIGTEYQTAVSVTDGLHLSEMCGTFVARVYAELNWKKVKTEKGE